MGEEVMNPTHCLTFDIEEHFQVGAFESPMRRRHWDHFESRVEANTERILEVLTNHRVLSTFFVLGWVAERHKDLIRRIAASGHEIASHGYEHQHILAQLPHQFREDVKKTKRILEDITGQSVHGYRAPNFSITSETKWALQILAEEQYTYDSSIFPIYHDQYGLPGANPFVHKLFTDSGSIWEIPPSTLGEIAPLPVDCV